MSDILLVEDDAQLARNLIRFLRAEGFSVTHRISQTAALEAFAAQKFDCALVDISLAEGNGFSVCAAIKRESATPVIFLTASADEDCTVAGFEIGADDYISKPFRPRELIARMKNVMRRSKPADTMISCGDVVVDTSRGTVTKDGSEVFLSPMEYRLLLVFFTNKEKVLSRDRLADELWSYSGEFISDNTLNVYIKRLREKIEDDPQDPKIIRTVRGLGYKAVER
ncbi:MAG: response regulator transcription factor [Ruminococcus sp.]|nr:response regulator transcription factor [Ruminococcus sp.]